MMFTIFIIIIIVIIIVISIIIYIGYKYAKNIHSDFSCWEMPVRCLWLCHLNILDLSEALWQMSIELPKHQHVETI